jgi:hypothetical protein
VGVPHPSERDQGRSPGRLLDEQLVVRIEQVIRRIPLDEGGGASLLKILLLGDLIVERPVLRLVEIGVYRGRLLLPLALIMRWREAGEAVGIDPYSASAAAQRDDHGRPIDLQEWAAGIDWEGAYEGVRRDITWLGLDGHCRIIRGSSADVVGRFPVRSIDLLHIDGNHDRAAVLNDARLYIPRVSQGGFVVLDDASWSSVKPVRDCLSQHHELVFELFDSPYAKVDEVGGNDFAVFRIRS